MSDIIDDMGLRAIIKVNGFFDAKNWAYDMVRAGVVKCQGGKCDNAATHIFWQDRAEWYCLCEEHREYGEMWTGHTNWNPTSFSLNLLPDKGRDWYAGLDSDRQERVRLAEYDKTDYYALLAERYWDTPKIYLEGDEASFFRAAVQIYALTDGRFAYEVSKQWGQSVTWCYPLTAPFASAEAALDAARAAYADKTLSGVE